MFSKQFWLAALDRAARSAAQAALVILGADTVNVLTVDWPQVAGLSAGMAVASLLTSVATSGAGGTPGPGLMETLKEKDRWIAPTTSAASSTSSSAERT